MLIHLFFFKTQISSNIGESLMLGFMLTQIYFKLRVLFCGESIFAGVTQKWGHHKLMGVTMLAIDPFQVGIT